MLEQKKRDSGLKEIVRTHLLRETLHRNRANVIVHDGARNSLFLSSPRQSILFQEALFFGQPNQTKPHDTQPTAIERNRYGIRKQQLERMYFVFWPR